jgi:hypothetical protein
MSGALLVRRRAFQFQHLSIDREYSTPEFPILCWWPRTKDDKTNLIMVLEMFREVSFFESISSTKMIFKLRHLTLISFY